MTLTATLRRMVLEKQENFLACTLLLSSHGEVFAAATSSTKAVAAMARPYLQATMGGFVF